MTYLKSTKFCSITMMNEKKVSSVTKFVYKRIPTLFSRDISQQYNIILHFLLKSNA